jgi:hypothetical protein
MKWLAKCCLLATLSLVPFAAGCGGSYISEEAARRQESVEDEEDTTDPEPSRRTRADDE